MKKVELINYIYSATHASAWKRGVIDTAIDMVCMIDGDYVTVDSPFYNGADSALSASYGGVFLIYDVDIARRFCTHSELKRKKGGELPPNSRETWLDLQARAIFQAKQLIIRILTDNE